MARLAALRLWDETPDNAVTRNFVIETKLIDFDNPSEIKGLQGIIFTCTQQSAGKIFNFLVQYRENINDDYRFLTFVTNNTNTVSNTAQDSIIHKHIFNIPIEIYTVQLKISGLYLQGNVGINDINIIYREHREVSTATFDEA